MNAHPAEIALEAAFHEDTNISWQRLAVSLCLEKLRFECGAEDRRTASGSLNNIGTIERARPALEAARHRRNRGETMNRSSRSFTGRRSDSQFCLNRFLLFARIVRGTLNRFELRSFDDGFFFTLVLTLQLFATRFRNGRVRRRQSRLRHLHHLISDAVGFAFVWIVPLAHAELWLNESAAPSEKARWVAKELGLGSALQERLSHKRIRGGGRMMGFFGRRVHALIMSRKFAAFRSSTGAGSSR
jgi:hypothetical protein